MTTAPQFTLGSRAASMTDALLPAAPQPLEKENDDYFRKVGGELSDPLCPLKLWSALMGVAAGVGLARRGRGQEGTRGADAGREGERGCVRLGARSRWQPDSGAQVHGRAARR